MHTRVKLLEGMQMKTVGYSKYSGGYSQIILEDISPRFSAPMGKITNYPPNAQQKSALLFSDSYKNVRS